MNLKQPRVTLYVSGKRCPQLHATATCNPQTRDGTHEIEVYGLFPFKADPKKLRTFRLVFAPYADNLGGEVVFRAAVRFVEEINAWGSIRRTLVTIVDPKQIDPRSEVIEVSQL